MVYVGKAVGLHTRTQEEIHALLQARPDPRRGATALPLRPHPFSSPRKRVRAPNAAQLTPNRAANLCRQCAQEFASAGACVVRLKGGDPLVFGRGGEECDYLRERGVSVAVTPGITAAAGIAADLGVPLTHRGVATSVRFITGHLKGESGEEDAAEAVALGATAADIGTTLVVYMGLGTLPALTAALLGAGLSARTPAVAVENGTTAAQRRVWGRLGGLAAATRHAALVSPTLVLIGGVVALSPLWPWPRGDGTATDWQLQHGAPGADADADAEAEAAWAQEGGAEARTWVRLPDGSRVALPRPRRAGREAAA
jgi:siroheme synthase